MSCQFVSNWLSFLFLRPTRHKKGHFEDVLPSQSLWKTKSNITKANMHLEQNMVRHEMNTNNRSQDWLPPTTSGLETERAYSQRSKKVRKDKQLHWYTTATTKLWQPGAESSRLDTREHKPQQLAERRWVHRHYVAQPMATVTKILAVDNTPRHAETFCCLIVLMQEVHLHKLSIYQSINLSKSYDISVILAPFKTSVQDLLIFNLFNA